MADYLSRACRLQLTTAMENLIRTAVFEISQIFEDNLYDHQMELARKGEEIAYLKVKLQRAELRLKEVSAGNGLDPSSNPSYESLEASEEPVPQQSSTVSEVDFEVPDNWCVPLDSDNVKQENSCPSVRLRQFSIPLFPIPLKHEAFRKLEESRLRSRHSKDTPQTGLQEGTKVKRKRGRPRRSENNQVKDVIMKIKEESFDTEVQPLKRKVGRPKLKIPKIKNTNMNETPANPSRGTYACRFCPKVFDTQFGLSVHDRAHKKCRGCKRIFPFPSVLKQHKAKCKYYKKLMQSSNVSPKEIVSKENSSIKQKDKSLVQITSSVRKRKMFTCKCCLKKFDSRSHLMQHPCFISCQMCHKRLSSRMALAVHIGKMHKSVTHKTETKLEASWTIPLDEMEDIKEKKVPPNERAKGLIKHCPQGFKCVICKRIYSSKYTAIEHTFVHTGERPFSCAFCSETFAKKNALSVHRKKVHGYVVRKHYKCACSKRFWLKSKYKEHKLICPKAKK